MTDVRNYNSERYDISGKVSVRNGMIPKKRYKLTKEGKKFVGRFIAVTLGATTILTLSIKRHNDHKPVEIPDDKMVYYVDYEVKTGDNWNSINKKFYDDEKGIETKGQFNVQVKEANPDGLRPGHNIKVPNIIDANNPLYLKLVEVDKELNKLKYDKYEEYYVQDGETVSRIAEKIVSNVDQVNECVSMINSVNGLGKILNPGIIKVPKIGYFQLLQLRDELLNELNDSLTNDEENTHQMH